MGRGTPKRWRGAVPQPPPPPRWSPSPHGEESRHSPLPPASRSRTRRPAAISAEAVALSISSLPSARITLFTPASASPPPSIPLRRHPAAVGEDAGLHRLAEADPAHRRRRRPDARPRRPSRGGWRSARGSPESASPRSRDRSAGCWSYGSGPRSLRRNPGRPRRRPRSSHNIDRRALPKVKLFIVPWLGASAPAARRTGSR